MTRDHRSSRPVLARLRHGLTVAAIATVATVALNGGRADASVRTSSETIAHEASRALNALDRWQEQHSPADYVRYVQSRETVAIMTAIDLDLDVAALRAEWASVPVGKQEAVLAAMSQLGVPYRSMKSEPGVGFDCSGLTIWAYAQADLEIPRVSRDQIRAGVRVDAEDAEAGDLVYYPGHISMYLGVGAMVHSPNSGNDVEAVTLPERSLTYADAFAAAGDD